MVFSTPFVSAMKSFMTESPAITTPMQHGSFDAIILPSRLTTLTSSMSSSFAYVSIMCIDIALAEPILRTTVRATCSSIVSIAPATVSCTSMTP